MNKRQYGLKRFPANIRIQYFNLFRSLYTIETTENNSINQMFFKKFRILFYFYIHNRLSLFSV